MKNVLITSHLEERIWSNKERLTVEETLHKVMADFKKVFPAKTMDWDYSIISQDEESNNSNKHFISVNVKKNPEISDQYWVFKKVQLSKMLNKAFESNFVIQ